MLRNLTSSLVHFEEKSSAEKIILSYVNKSNTAWLQLYAFLCSQTGCLITERLPGAKAINALMQAEKNPDNAPARLSRIIKEERKRHIDGSTNGRKLYTRLFAECKVAIPGLQHLMVDVNIVQAMITILRELAYSKLEKELSHVGSVSMTVDQAAQFYGYGHGKQLCATRDVVMCRNFEGVEEKTSIYVIDRDLGNVAIRHGSRACLIRGRCMTSWDKLPMKSLWDVVRWCWDSSK